MILLDLDRKWLVKIFILGKSLYIHLSVCLFDYLSMSVLLLTDSLREIEDLNRGRALVRDILDCHSAVLEHSIEDGIRTVAKVRLFESSFYSFSR